jgi:hypothetical protein
MRTAYTIFVGNPDGKRPLGNLDVRVDGRVIIKWI